MPILFVTLIGSAVLAQSVWSPIQESYYCDLGESSAVSKGTPPKWSDRDDIRLLIREAGDLVTANMYQCAESLRFTSSLGFPSNTADLDRFDFANPSMDSLRSAFRGRRVLSELDILEGFAMLKSQHGYMYKVGNRYYPGHSIIGFSVEYQQIRERRDTAGSIEPLYFNMNNIGGGFNRKDAEYFNQVLFAEIKVYPTVIHRGYYWIKSEKRWARSAKEAVAFVIAHEIAHLELFFEEHYVRESNDRSASRDVKNDSDRERWADLIASDLMRCVDLEDG